MPLMEVTTLKAHFEKNKGLFSKFFDNITEVIHAVDGASFDIRKGETFGLVGESGCGKTTTGKAILRLIPGDVIKGKISFEGSDIYKFSAGELREFRRHAQIIFQNPVTSLNPRMRVGEIIAEPFRIHYSKKSTHEIDREVEDLLELVSLSKSDRNKYPAELSGGQNRRVGIARSIALRPKFVVCDEPTSGLDVSIAADIINLMKNLQRELGLTYLWISHNLRVVSYVSDRIAVMYLGRIIEMGKTSAVFGNPIHRYTRSLFSAGGRAVGSGGQKKIILEGEVPSPINVPSGCRFHTRCWDCEAECRDEEPLLTPAGGEHFVACHKPH